MTATPDSQNPDPRTPDIELRDVVHRYGERTVLRGIDLTIARGEIFGFLGHNGAGKTTTVSILTTLIRPTSGTARVCGFDVVRQRTEVTGRIGYLPADVRLYDHLSALENLEFLGRLSGVDDPRQAAREALDYLGCADLGPHRVGGFSTGMRQRIGIAQAVLHKPQVLFLDEPTAGGGTGMRRRLAAAMLLVAALAVVGFGVPLAVAVERLYRDEALLLLSQQAAAAVVAVPASFSGIDLPELPRAADGVDLALYDQAGRRLAGTLAGAGPQRRPDGAVVEVADGGEARLDPAAVFVRRTSGAGGTGIGLALARRLAEAEGMRLVLASAGPGPVFHLVAVGRQAGAAG